MRSPAFEHGKPGLVLSGSGPFNPIERGKPRASSINRIPVPRGGLASPRSAANRGAIHATAGQTGVRISSALGEVKVDFHKVTHGLARGSSASISTANRNTQSNTVWNASSTSGANAVSAAGASAASSGASSVAANGASSVAAVVAAAANAGSIGGNGNGNGANGNGNAFGLGNGNGGVGNGNGNGGVGNGNGRGNLKH